MTAMRATNPAEGDPEALETRPVDGVATPPKTIGGVDEHRKTAEMSALLAPQTTHPPAPLPAGAAPLAPHPQPHPRPINAPLRLYLHRRTRTMEKTKLWNPW